VSTHSRLALAVALVVVIASAACHPAVRVGAPCGSSQAFLPFDVPAATPPAAEAPHGVLEALVAWYQRDGRAPEMPGVGCPFAPTCSVYARTALRRYGPVAVVLIVDRLIVREHLIAGDYYPTRCVAHTTRLVDGVP
jgi:putative component of membrane protein insertase Oxa1/YidC/SpoIIIJ protein YidD